MGKYAEKLRDPRWQKTRLRILERDQWKCQLCGDESTELQVHHLSYVTYEPWETPDEFLISYCKHCHSVISWLDSGFAEPILATRKRIQKDGSVLIFAVHLIDRPNKREVKVYEVTDRSIRLECSLLKQDVGVISGLFNYAPD